jgi:hypothetical protein
MAPRIIGEHPLATDEHGRPKVRIATIFPLDMVLVTLPGVHATQKLAYLKEVNAQRVATGRDPLYEEEEEVFFQNAVDLIVEEQTIFIRPNPDNMELAFKADETLQELAPKQRIQYLFTQNPAVRLALKRRGECWRINPLPQTPEAMRQMIRSARIGITGRDIYYYSKITGSRFLTCEEFARLGALPDAELAQHLAEIREHIGRKNALRNPEIVFFLADKAFDAAAFAACPLPAGDPARLQAAHADLQARFCAAVPAALRRDDPDDPEWRARMFAALIGLPAEAVTEDRLLGLSSEFFMQIEWLPGGRLENGELIFDSVFEAADQHPDDPALRALCDDKAQGFIFNFIREYGDVDYINVGRVIASLSKREPGGGRRGVYVAEIKTQTGAEPIVRIIRMQKWGIREHLDDHKPLLQAIMEAEEYTDYILDRRLGCRQLGMNLPQRITTHSINERYDGANPEGRGQLIRSTYFERDYILGIATDKIPPVKFARPEYALPFARLLGAAAAVNLIVGRGNHVRPVIFDDGDEIVLENAQGMPVSLIVADHTGAFHNYRDDLAATAPEYARPLTRRLAHVAGTAEFIEAFLAALVEKFTAIQAEYRRRRRAFDLLFKHRPRDEHGSFAFRWEMVLKRLDSADPRALAELIRRRATA